MADGDAREGAGENDSSGEPVGRAPQGFVETALANCRPQPAIPGLLVLFLTVLIAVFTHEPGVERSAWALLFSVALVASCGLAIAASFCSFFPATAWILVAGWAMKFAQVGPLPPYNRIVLLVGMGAAAATLILQGWRVATGRFVPTIRDGPEEENRG